MKPLLVGESNPYSSNPADALLPFPAGSAGHRFCEVILAMSPREYLRAFERRNLFGIRERWSAPEARRRAGGIAREWAAPVIALGSKVAAAFAAHITLPPEVMGAPAAFTDYALPRQPWETPQHPERRLFVLPHPSGRCRVWNEPDAFDRAREMIARARGCRTCGGQVPPLRCRMGSCSERAVCAVSTVGDGNDRDDSLALEFGGPACAEHCGNHECGCSPVLPGGKCPECRSETR